ncbi:hypothetical protein [Chryseosolibacter indicus]|uniref:Uncharacterized protein n=1 Tax=Chryseosolibacter indicus TaxID=2782351 RepID=A0ABS5VTN9_9BACT|nr:hypothetical protein [Chryseosolibacter indicus]MBT1704134.1 hypothetical protein [Chryseosolibacter indicus]
MKAKFPLVFLLLCITEIVLAQTRINTIEVSDTIISATVDRPGELYIVTKTGQIHRYSEDGKLMALYKAKSVPTLFEPRDGARLFAYYRETQQYDLLNPSFDVTRSFRVDSAFAIRPWLVCPSGDNKLWILDQEDNSLKRVNMRESVVETEANIDLKIIKDASVFTAMKEYQGFVFLLHPQQGVYIFNALGKHIKTIEVRGISSLQFLGEELYYIKNNKAHLFNLFTADTRVIALPSVTLFTLITDRRLYQLSNTSILVSTFTP